MEELEELEELEDAEAPACAPLCACASAPAKAILFGEHAAVFGRRAAACALSAPRTCATATRWPTGGRGSGCGGGGALSAVLRVCTAPPLARTWRDEDVRAVRSRLPRREAIVGDPSVLARKHPALLRAVDDALAAAADASGPPVVSPSRPAPAPAAAAAGAFRILLLLACAMPAVLAPPDAAGADARGRHDDDDDDGDAPQERLHVVVRSDIPPAAGLGSSAALSASLAAALLRIAAPACACGLGGAAHARTFCARERETINRWAFLGECLAHGRPSGIDNTVVVFGGLLAFSLSERAAVAHPPPLRLLVVDTRAPRSTHALLARVRAAREADPQRVDAVFERIENLTDRFLALVPCLRLSAAPVADAGADAAASAAATLDALVRENHELLASDLGVGHPALDRAVAVAAREGLALKLTGAGGGGCAVGFLPAGCDAHAVVARLAAEGFDARVAAVDSVGVVPHPAEAVAAAAAEGPSWST